MPSLSAFAPRTRSAVLSAAIAVALSSSLCPTAAAGRIAVLPLAVRGSATAGDAQTLGEQLSTRLLSSMLLNVVGPADVRLDSLRKLHPAACDSACMGQLGAACGVDFVFAGYLDFSDSVSVVGGTLHTVSTGASQMLVFPGPGGAAEVLRSVSTLAGALAGVCATADRPQGAMAQRHQSRTAATAERPRAPARTATLRVLSIPPGATVFLNGKQVGIAPYADSLVPGTYALKVNMDGCETFLDTVKIGVRELRNVSVPLVSRTGSLVVLSSPSPARISINDRPRGTTPHTERGLLPGSYLLSLSHDSCVSVTRLHTVLRGATDTVRVSLMNSDSLKAARTVSRKRRQMVRRIGFGVLAAGFAAGGLIANGEVSEQVQIQQAAADRYNTPRLTATEYDAAYSDYTAALSAARDAADTRNALYIVGGVFAVGFTLSIWF